LRSQGIQKRDDRISGHPEDGIQAPLGQLIDDSFGHSLMLEHA
jgi:hypothetical protein